jgi:FkbM family methyltransferase
MTPGRGWPGRLAGVRAWTGSLHTRADAPAALLLAVCRTRPGLARLVQRVAGRVWLRPGALHGLRVGIDPTQLATFTIYDEIFIDGLYDFDRLGFEPDVVVDCGAFEGYFSLLARARFAAAAIVAFEPDARNFAGLLANTTGRAGLAIAARAAAVSTADGDGAFVGGGCGGHLADASPGTVRVPIRSLLAELEDLKPERLLLKLDIEGEEARLLPALLPVLPPTCALFFEWHQGRASFDEMSAQLGHAGFQTSVVREHQFDDVVYIDAFAQRP